MTILSFILMILTVMPIMLQVMLGAMRLWLEQVPPAWTSVSQQSTEQEKMVGSLIFRCAGITITKL